MTFNKSSITFNFILSISYFNFNIFKSILHQILPFNSLLREMFICSKVEETLNQTEIVESRNSHKTENEKKTRP